MRGRPGAVLPPLDLDKARATAQEKSGHQISDAHRVLRVLTKLGESINAEDLPIVLA